MEPNCDTQVTLVDLLDRILDKGVMLNADIIISISGIPLIGINLRAAIASVDTMLRYGIWEDWDAAQRVIATKERRGKRIDKLPLLEGEEIILEMPGSYWYSKGMYRNWRLGRIYVTDRQVFLCGKEPAKIIFEAFYEDIGGFALERKKNSAKKETDYFYLFLKSGAVARLHPTEVYPLKEAIERRMNERGLHFERRAVPMMDEVGEL